MRTDRPVLLVARGLDPVGTGCELEHAAVGFAAAGQAVVVAVTSSGGSVPGRLAARGFAVHRLGRRPVVDAGATCVIHPGGSMRDEEVIAAADERGIVMVLTGTRHFRH